MALIFVPESRNEHNLVLREACLEKKKMFVWAVNMYAKAIWQKIGCDNSFFEIAVNFYVQFRSAYIFFMCRA